jgi:hypothetical protein
MKFSKWFFVAWINALVFCTFPALAAPPAGTNFFPIMIYNGAPNDLATLKKMRECGVTIAGFATPAALDACQAAGLKAIVSDPRVGGYDWAKVDETVARKNVAALVAKVGKHPAVYGYYLRDEPGADLFPGLAKVSSLVRELAPGKLPYVNCFPNYANDGQLGDSNYVSYLEKFIDTVKPLALSYDNYSLMDDGSLREGFWSNLEQMRAAAKKHGLPFWNTVLAVAHFNYQEPTDAGLRFQAYSTLVYGGRGICYFTYFAPQLGNYRMAAIDQFGNETPTWHNLQNVNLQIQKLAPVVLQLTSDAVYHIGKIPNGCQAPPPDSLVTGVSGDDFVVGDFTHADGGRYVMIVNKDRVHSRPCDPKFRNPPGPLKMVSPYTGQLTPFEGEQVWLAPGAGVLLKIGK